MACAKLQCRCLINKEDMVRRKVLRFFCIISKLLITSFVTFDFDGSCP